MNETLLIYINHGFCPSPRVETVDPIDAAAAAVLARTRFFSAEDIHRKFRE